MSTQLLWFCATHRKVGIVVAYIEKKIVSSDVLGKNM
jgi:hypothetical protein